MYLPKFRLSLAACCVLTGLLSGCSPAQSPQQTVSQQTSPQQTQTKITDVAKATQADSTEVKPVRELFERVAGKAVPNVHFTLLKDDQTDWYQIEARDGQLYVSANALTALSSVSYTHLTLPTTPYV